MKVCLINKTTFVLILFGILLVSCKKDRNDLPSAQSLGGHALDSDEALPYSYPNWMAGIPDNTPLSMITIPGTHDAGADLHTSLQGSASWETICQDFRLSNQLLLGVRWIDVRWDADDGMIHHGPFNLAKGLQDFFSTIRTFLNNNPSEAVIFNIKQENSSRSDAEFSDMVWQVMNFTGFNYNMSLFYLDDHMPTMGQIRGKLVITRHDISDDGGHSMGAPFTWPDNTTGHYGQSNHYIYYVQDHYSINYVDYSTKCDEIKATINLAHNQPDQNRLNINFTSGERDLRATSILTVAENINQNIKDYLLSVPNWDNCGVILVNYAGGSDEKDNGGLRCAAPDLVAIILQHNSFTNIKDSIKIGSQWWMGKDLTVTHYRNGDPIPKVDDFEEWINLSTGAYCDYTSYGNTSRLYNWYAVNDSRGLAPAGWHIPTDAEFSTLMSTLGGSDIAGGHMKQIGPRNWLSPNSGANNSSFFTALPGGCRSGVDDDGYGYFNKGVSYSLWSATSSTTQEANTYYLYFADTRVQKFSITKRFGSSVRCVKN
ncbi:MAG: phosphatidylinositol-specific phospholipase C domain-containing protein [Bacteroidales bacterium]